MNARPSPPDHATGTVCMLALAAVLTAGSAVARSSTAATLTPTTTASADEQVLAQTVYRCGADGRSYSQQPCKDGDGRRVQADDSRTPAQVREAQAIAAREKQHAEALRQERLAREASNRVVVKPAPKAARPGTATEPDRAVPNKKSLSPMRLKRPPGAASAPGAAGPNKLRPGSRP